MPSQITIEIPDSSKFIPPSVGGDQEFKGNGPQVRVYATIAIRNENQIWLTVGMWAKETVADYTEVDGRADWVIYQHPKKIQKIISNTSSEYSYTAVIYDLSDKMINLPSTELVKTFIITADTAGPEAGTKTGVRVIFNPVVIEEME
jgi:hypothetical protein